MIERLETWVSPTIDGVLFAAAQFALIALLALALDSTWLRRVGPRVRLHVWLAVLLPLAVPLRAAIPIGAPSSTSLPLEVASHDVTRSPRFGPHAMTAPRGRPPKDAGNPEFVQVSTAAEGARRVAGPRGTATDVAAERTRDSTLERSRDLEGPWRAVSAVAWLIGALLVGMKLLASELRLRATLRTAPACGERVHSLAAEACRVAGLSRPLRALRCDSLGSPAVHGLWRPRLLVPVGAEALRDDELLAVLVHEAFHVRRRDLLWLPLLAALRAAWWFHPLVPTAMRRMADALEETRDQDALGALAAQCGETTSRTAHSPVRIAYARVLLRLAEARAEQEINPPANLRPVAAPGAIPMTRDGRGLARRIDMIIKTPPTRHLTALAGAGVALALTGLGLVRASSPASVEVTGPRQQSDAATVHVEHAGPIAPWRTELKAKLAARVAAVDLAGPPADVFGGLGDILGARLRIDVQAIRDAGVERIELRLRDVTGAEALEVACLQLYDFDWSLSQGSIVVGQRDEIPRDMDLRLYRIAPLLEARGIDGDDVLDVVSNFANYEHDPLALDDPFERIGASMELWRGLLAVRTTDDHHRSIETMLGRLLTAEHAPTPAPSPWRPALEQALATEVVSEPGVASSGEVMRMVVELIGSPVVMVGASVDEMTSPLELPGTGEAAGDLLQRAAELEERHVVLSAGTIVLSWSKMLETRLHDISELLARSTGAEDDMVMEIADFCVQIDPESWDENPHCSVIRVGDLLVVRQTPEVQVEIGRLLGQLDRALGGR